jgi:hypothetical protein
MTDALNKANTGNINNMVKLAPLLSHRERGNEGIAIKLIFITL